MKASTWQAGVLTAVILFLGLWAGLRAGQAWLSWETLEAFGAPAAYIFGSGLAWAIGWLAILAGLLSGWRQIRRAGIAFFVLYWVWYWADRLLMQVSPAPNLMASIVLSIILLALGIGLWFLPGNDIFSEELEEKG
jgi:hypothetical protein